MQSYFLDVFVIDLATLEDYYYVVVGVVSH